jgi:hypothetical protein
MRLKLCQVAMMVLAGFAGLVLAGCGRSQSAGDKSGAVEVHGERISAAAAPASVNATPAKPTEPKTAMAAAVATIATEAGKDKGQAVASPVADKPAVVEPRVPASKSVEAGVEYQMVGFDKLASYNFEIPDDGPVTNLAGPDKADGQIPDRVKAFDHKKVSIKGFMLPLKVESGTVSEFLILKDQSMCCYGNVPKITEWVSVKASGKGVKPIMDQPVSIEGTLHVGAMRENGYLVGIYQMEGEKLVMPGE